MLVVCLGRRTDACLARGASRQGVRIQLPGPPKPHGRFSSVAFTQRVMFVAVAPSGAPIPNSAKMIRLHPPHLLGLEIHKNFLAVVSNDGKRLYMVIKTSPFMICQLNVRTGLCKVSAALAARMCSACASTNVWTRTLVLSKPAVGYFQL